MNLLILILISTLFVCGVYMETFEDVRKLYDYITIGRNTHLRPQLDQKEATAVNISLFLLALHEVSAVDGTVNIGCFFAVTWKDENLNWTPSDFNETQIIALPNNDIWKPPLVNSNSVTEMTRLSTDLTHVQLNNDGNALWRPGTNLKFMCFIDTTYFPFDTQVCDCEVLSWGYPNDPNPSITLSSTDKTIHMEHFEEDSEWDVTETKVVLMSQPRVRFRMHLKRKSLFLVATLLLPVIFLAFLNIFVFILPQESGERIGFSITLLLAVVVFMTIAQNILPATASPRLSTICILLLMNMTVSVLITVTVIATSWLYYKPNDETVPDWMRTLVRYTNWRRKSPKVQDSISNLTEKQGFTIKNSSVTVENMDDINWQRSAKALDKLFMVFYLICLVINTLFFICDITTNHHK